jgi:hypothetical protein
MEEEIYPRIIQSAQPATSGDAQNLEQARKMDLL